MHTPGRASTEQRGCVGKEGGYSEERQSGLGGCRKEERGGTCGVTQWGQLTEGLRDPSLGFGLGPMHAGKKQWKG